jgi:hypothetical protein
VVIQSADNATPLLELFTSEGCSSCPPAEEWFGRLKGRAGLWKEFVPIAFHVDYWDHLGWRDPFAQRAFTSRQQAYAAEWRSRSIYTPGFAWQGMEWSDWRRGFPTSAVAKGGRLRADWDGRRLSVTFDCKGTWDVHASILGCDIVVPVKAGENAGRTLSHDFVALNYKEISVSNFPAVLELAPPTVNPAKRLALAVWISLRGKPAAVQAAGGWLPSR